LKKIELREITPQNFKECINLKVADSQNSFVASNLMTIAQAKIIFPSASLKAIYADDKMVGFTMFGLDEDDSRYYLGRLMIDENHQSKGYGKAAVLEVIEELQKIEDCREIYLSFVPENVSAEKLYESVGFKKTGELNGNELIMKFAL
jgi:diamine N-acetyltransferase